MKISSEPTRLQSIMFSLNMFLFTLAVTLLTVTVESSNCGDRSINHNYDLSGPELTRLYNAKVYLAERMKRPLGGFLGSIGIPHAGVRVTLADGKQWLIHKGCKFGISSQTVVVDAEHMSQDWKVEKYQHFDGRKTVADFVRTGGSDYNVLFDNCIWAAGRMMNQ